MNYMNSLIYLFIYLFIHLFVYSFIYLFVYLLIYLLKTIRRLNFIFERVIYLQPFQFLYLVRNIAEAIIQRCSAKKADLENFVKFTRKQLC